VQGRGLNPGLIGASVLKYMVSMITYRQCLTKGDKCLNWQVVMFSILNYRVKFGQSVMWVFLIVNNVSHWCCSFWFIHHFVPRICKHCTKNNRSFWPAAAISFTGTAIFQIIPVNIAPRIIRTFWEKCFLTDSSGQFYLWSNICCKSLSHILVMRGELFI
jgi:hypothetical protein